MKFYEKDNIFYIINSDSKIPIGANLYEIGFPTDVDYQSYKEIFPQFELTILSCGNYGFTNYLRITYKNKYEFIPNIFVNNKPNYIIRMLNDLANGDYEKVILTYIKSSVTDEKYLEIKSSLNQLSSLEEIKLENQGLKIKLDEKLKIIGNLELIRQEKNRLQIQLDEKNKEILNLAQKSENYKNQLKSIKDTIDL